MKQNVTNCSISIAKNKRSPRRKDRAVSHGKSIDTSINAADASPQLGTGRPRADNGQNKLRRCVFPLARPK